MVRRMKKYYIVILLVLMFPCFAHALDVDVSISGKSIFPLQENLSTSNVLELEANYNGILGWISYEKNMMRFIGQECADISLLGFGLGYEIDIFKNVSIAIKGGYYQPTRSYRHSYQEAIVRQIYAYTAPVENWEGGQIDYLKGTCEYEISGGFGGTVEINWKIPITNWLNLNLIAGWRYLNLKDRISADIHGLYDGAYHEFVTYRDWSGGVIGVSITFRF